GCPAETGARRYPPCLTIRNSLQDEVLERGRRRELRRALLAERGQPLAHVVPGESEALERQRCVEGRPGQAQPVVQGVLGPADRRRRACRQTLRQPERRLVQGVVVDA